MRLDKHWVDEPSGLTINYTEKNERKGSNQVIFLFSSIRSKQHWLDFKGPGGASIQTNRARIVFLQDDFSAQWSYHLALNGSLDPLEATRRFVMAYVRDHDYAWQDLTLAGMSKGGIASLIVGAGLPRCRVVTVSPELVLGRSLQKLRPEVLYAMVGEKEGAVERVDDLLWSSLKAPEDGSGVTQCFIFTSQSDDRCTGGLQQLQECLPHTDIRIYIDDSDQAAGHVATVRYLSSPFLAFLAVIGSGATPLLG